MVTKQCDILISGAGIPGLTIAILLADFGMQITLLEPFPPPAVKDIKPSGRTVALMNSSINILKAVGIWAQIEPLATPLQTMRIIDDSAPGRAPIEAPFDADAIALEQYGYNIPNMHLRAALYDHARQHKNIDLIEQSLSALDVQQSSATAALEDGTQIRAPLVIGADGRNSPVREQAGIAVRKNHYDQSAITCLINHSKHHQNTATEFHRPGGPLAFVPMQGNQSSVVWVEKTPRAEGLMALSEQQFQEALQEASGDILGGLTIEAPPQSWPLMSLEAKSYTAPRIALVAETIHVMSPVTAQGLNLSLRDVAALAETIADHARLGLDIGMKATLDEYDRRRRLDVKTRALGVDGMNRLVAQDSAPIKNIRRRALKAVHSIPPLKRLAMHHGLAPTLDEGRLAAGEKL